MTSLVLVRHGQASFAARNYDVLSPLGIQQGVHLGEYWSQMQPRFDAVYSGLMERQLHTARHAFATLGRDVTVEQHTAFDEYDHQTLIRAYSPVIARDHPDMSLDRRELFSDPRKFQLFFEKVVACWLAGREGDCPVTETWSAFVRRVVDGLHAVCPPGRESTVVFTSGGVITVALQEALGLEPMRAFGANWRIYNASVHTFQVGKRGLSLMGFNNVAHLELRRDPALFTFR